MKIPQVTARVLEQVMDQFDKELRNTSTWERWQEDEVYKYAIERNGKLYPVKKIVSLATNVPVDQFSGGQQANSYVEELGLKVIEIPPAVRGIKTNFDRILAEHKNASLEPLTGSSTIRSTSGVYKCLRDMFSLPIPIGKELGP
jgi:hypothetical protein